ncbi:MAG: nitroreductase family protein [Desulfobacterales bacterium]
MKQSFLEKFSKAHLPPTRFPRFEYEPENCTQCKACVDTCPTSCLQWDAEKKQPYATGLDGIELACIACNNCEAVCPGDCIRMRGEYRVLEGRYKTPEDKFGEMSFPRPFGENDAHRSYEEIARDLTETEKMLYERRSIRLFKNKPVPREILQRLVEAGRFAPSAGNGQPFKFLVVTDPETISAVDKQCAKVLTMIKKAYLGNGKLRKSLISLLSAISANKWDQRPIAAMEKVNQNNDSITFGAPVVIHVLKDKRGISHPDICTALAAHNMVLAAHSLGLGTCYIGFIASTIPYAPRVRKMLGIEYPYELVTSICVGYPKLKYDRPVARGQVPVEWIEAN